MLRVFGVQWNRKRWTKFKTRRLVKQRSGNAEPKRRDEPTAPCPVETGQCFRKAKRTSWLRSFAFVFLLLCPLCTKNPTSVMISQAYQRIGLQQSRAARHFFAADEKRARLLRFAGLISDSRANSGRRHHFLTSRSSPVYRHFRVGRYAVRERLHRGDLFGLRKASWSSFFGGGRPFCTAFVFALDRLRALLHSPLSLEPRPFPPLTSAKAMRFFRKHPSLTALPLAVALSTAAAAAARAALAAVAAASLCFGGLRPRALSGRNGGLPCAPASCSGNVHGPTARQGKEALPAFDALSTLSTCGVRKAPGGASLLETAALVAAVLLVYSTTFAESLLGGAFTAYAAETAAAGGPAGDGAKGGSCPVGGSAFALGVAAIALTGAALWTALSWLRGRVAPAMQPAPSASQEAARAAAELTPTTSAEIPSAPVGFHPAAFPFTEGGSTASGGLRMLELLAGSGHSPLALLLGGLLAYGAAQGGTGCSAPFGGSWNPWRAAGRPAAPPATPLATPAATPAAAAVGRTAPQPGLLALTGPYPLLHVLGHTLAPTAASSGAAAEAGAAASSGAAAEAGASAVGEASAASTAAAPAAAAVGRTAPRPALPGLAEHFPAISGLQPSALSAEGSALKPVVYHGRAVTTASERVFPFGQHFGRGFAGGCWPSNVVVLQGDVRGRPRTVALPASEALAFLQRGGFGGDAQRLPRPALLPASPLLSQQFLRPVRPAASPLAWAAAEAEHRLQHFAATAALQPMLETRPMAGGNAEAEAAAEASNRARTLRCGERRALATQLRGASWPSLEGRRAGFIWGLPQQPHVNGLPAALQAAVEGAREGALHGWSGPGLELSSEPEELGWGLLGRSWSGRAANAANYSYARYQMGAVEGLPLLVLSWYEQVLRTRGEVRGLPPALQRGAGPFAGPATPADFPMAVEGARRVLYRHHQEAWAHCAQLVEEHLRRSPKTPLVLGGKDAAALSVALLGTGRSVFHFDQWEERGAEGSRLVFHREYLEELQELLAAPSPMTTPGGLFPPAVGPAIFPADWPAEALAEATAPRALSPVGRTSSAPPAPTAPTGPQPASMATDSRGEPLGSGPYQSRFTPEEAHFVPVGNGVYLPRGSLYGAPSAAMFFAAEEAPNAAPWGPSGPSGFSGPSAGSGSFSHREGGRVGLSWSQLGVAERSTGDPWAGLSGPDSWPWEPRSGSSAGGRPAPSSGEGNGVLGGQGREGREAAERSGAVKRTELRNAEKSAKKAAKKAEKKAEKKGGKKGRR